MDEGGNGLETDVTDGSLLLRSSGVVRVASPQALGWADCEGNTINIQVSRR
jgi:hypothetical protein